MESKNKYHEESGWIFFGAAVVFVAALCCSGFLILVWKMVVGPCQYRNETIVIWCLWIAVVGIIAVGIKGDIRSNVGMKECCFKRK